MTEGGKVLLLPYDLEAIKYNQCFKTLWLALGVLVFSYK